MDLEDATTLHQTFWMIVVMLLGVAVFYYAVVDFFIIRCFLSWFNPDKLRELETRHIKRAGPLYGKKALERVQTSSWLWTQRIVKTTWLILFFGFLAWAFLRAH